MPSVKLQALRRQRRGKSIAAKAVRAKRARAVAARREATAETRGTVAYHPTQGVDAYVRQVARATPLELVEIERQGVLGSFIKDLARRMEIPSSRMFTILGVPKATAEKKAAAGERVEGRGGQSAIGMVKLLGIAREIVANSTAAEAKTFDATRWLGQWIERPQPALGGRKPADLLDTPTGVELLTRLLGSLESGAYQ